MKTKHTISIALGFTLVAASAAFSAPLPVSKLKSGAAHYTLVEADCFAVGQDKAAELGGELAKASPDTVDGVPVCHIVVLVPGQDGARPQRVAMDIPQ
ncbi:MAG: hypothetical protein ACRCU5_05330 [Rhizobiaceae bacterium]